MEPSFEGEVIDPLLETAPPLPDEKLEEGKRNIRDFLSRVRCESLIHSSGKSVIFNVSISLRVGFKAFTEHDVKCAPLWNPRTHTYVGMATVTDFLELFRYMYDQSISKSNAFDANAVFDTSFSEWRDIPLEIRKLNMATSQLRGQLLQVSCESNLLEALIKLVSNHIHRLILIDGTRVLSVITHLRILEYLVRNFHSDRVFDKEIVGLGIGSFGVIQTANVNTPLIHVLNLLHDNHISAIPIVDDEGRLIDVYARTDVPNIPLEHFMEVLDSPIKSIIEYHDKRPEVMYTCQVTDTLQTAFERFAKYRMHRLYCVDDRFRVIGVVSLTDLFGYFLTSIEKAEEGIFHGTMDSSGIRERECAADTQAGVQADSRLSEGASGMLDDVLQPTKSSSLVDLLNDPLDRVRQSPSHTSSVSSIAACSPLTHRDVPMIGGGSQNCLEDTRNP